MKWKKQVNNLTIRKIGTTYKVITPDGRWLEEFVRPSDAIKCAKSIRDFLAPKTAMISEAKNTAILNPKKTKKAWNALGTPQKSCKNCGHSSLVHRHGPCTAWTCKRDGMCHKFQ